MPSLYPACTDDDLDAVRTLFREYAEALGVDLCFQNFDRELRTLPGEYAPPLGALLLAEVDGEAAGCVGLRPVDATTCEMKRLYVRPNHRGAGLGRQLAEAVLEAGRTAGYDAMVLDTLESLEAARTLYARLGFETVPPYYHNPLPGVVYMKRPL